MERIFRKQKMIDRLTKEGRLNQVHAEDYELMDKLDGHKANDYNYRSFVFGDNLSWIEPFEGCEGAYVCTEDCE